jgi:hypothetical protein
MKFKTGLVFGAAVGFAAAKWLEREDPALVKAPAQPARPQNPAVRLVTSQGRKLAGRATNAGMDAIHRARANIQARLGETADRPDPTWN